jgi:hypothetical protein
MKYDSHDPEDDTALGAGGRLPAPGGATDPLECLTALDLLSVGPVRLERRRLICPYRVVRGDHHDAFDLIYRWEEDVFDPSNPDDANLAAMIAAQPALNYGLFAREIRFLDPLDVWDREFLVAMAENTACEIYVKKFLEHNPFIIGQAARLPVVSRPGYLRSRITFRGGDATGSAAGSRGRWADPDPARHAVLSSGGKDSLLTFGILDELGRDTHPIFVNESGRHWYTALNAYRRFADCVPNTARVWTNADRLFAWMKRRLPFVRPDFARLRADEYPIRLWTVAVFLFGALPLIRKRGIGRLSVGNEFDTTRFAYHSGIAHYDGLFDQSIVFDRALTDYFAKKGWGIEQFSILRPLSEILIQKTLAARYPELLPYQVSCHAAHIENGRVRPCGACEKCRRIVGMLTAFGADPMVLGYSEGQIARCLADIDACGVHQEGEGAQHLYHLLWAQGKISGGGRTFLPHPEVERLRLDPGVSPVDAVPEDLRARVFDILREYVEGVVTWDGQAWVSGDFSDGRARTEPIHGGEAPPLP